MKNFAWLVLALFFGLWCVEPVSADSTIDYVVTTGDQFGTINLQNGAFTFVGNTGNLFEDITRIPGGPLYGIDVNGNLRIINTSNGSSSIVGFTGNGIQGVKEASNGTLYGFNRTNLYTLNASTGVATHIGSFGVTLGGSYYDAAFDGAGHLFAQGGSELYEVNLTTALATLVGTTAGYNVAALDFENGSLYASTGAGQIITIDTTTASGTLVANQAATISGTIFGLAPAGNPVPEPSTFALLCVGGIGLAFGAYRRRIAAV